MAVLLSAGHWRSHSSSPPLPQSPYLNPQSISGGGLEQEFAFRVVKYFLRQANTTCLSCQAKETPEIYGNIISTGCRYHCMYKWKGSVGHWR